MSNNKQRILNAKKIFLLKKMIEESTKRKVILEDKQEDPFKPKNISTREIKRAKMEEEKRKQREERIKLFPNTIKKLVNKEMSAGEALNLAIKLNDNSYGMDDPDIEALMSHYGYEDYNHMTGAIEQLLEKIGYKLKSSDLQSLDNYSIGSILVKLFYSGEAQQFVSNEFIKAVADKVTNKQSADELLEAITGGEPLYVDETGTPLKYTEFTERMKPILLKLKKFGNTGTL